MLAFLVPITLYVTSYRIISLYDYIVSKVLSVSLDTPRFQATTILNLR
jgi:hypothetical protein